MLPRRISGPGWPRINRKGEYSGGPEARASVVDSVEDRSEAPETSKVAMGSGAAQISKVGKRSGAPETTKVPRFRKVEAPE
ncbi:unnamed protein product [Anisakis simplex]|uniref:Uncharacterized protein n=1 Tax=Anisakis simplex TaxID=6269 RepID=A0A0M3J711_ANISI|nr:unnamed protein product [Anisakis simplex]